MPPDYRLFLSDIRTSCEKVLRYTAGMTFEGFTADEKTFDAVMRNLAIIGEAVKQLPQEFRDEHPEVEWRRIARFRDIAIHHYFAVDEQIVWDIVQARIPELLAQVGSALEGIAPDAGGAGEQPG